MLLNETASTKKPGPTRGTKFKPDAPGQEVANVIATRTPLPVGPGIGGAGAGGSDDAQAKLKIAFARSSKSGPTQNELRPVLLRKVGTERETKVSTLGANAR